MAALVSLIIPCYNEEKALPSFWKEAKTVTDQLTDYTFEFIFVDDGSRDGTLPILRELATEDSRVKYISFSRNFGKEAAMYAGFSHAQGEYAAVMDADLQDPPSLLPKLLHAVTEEGYDSAATRRVTRKGEPPIRSFFARVFYRIINRMSDVDIVDGARDFRLMNRKFLDLRMWNGWPEKPNGPSGSCSSTASRESLPLPPYRWYWLPLWASFSA